jgi:hypothetical protein
VLPDPLVVGLLVRALLPDDRGDLLARLRDRVIAALLAALVAGDCPDGDDLDARLATARTRAGAVLRDMAHESRGHGGAAGARLFRDVSI